jgi:transposase
MRQTQRYTSEFRADAIALIERNDRTITKIAEDLGMSHWTLRGWYNVHRMAKKAKPKPVGRPPREVLQEKETAEQKAERLERENEELRKKVASLETDKEILKKAAAFFAKESE